MMDIPVNHLSYSSVSLYQRCQLRWRYRYVDKIKTQATGKMLAGNAYHEAVAMCFEVKRMFGEYPPMSAMHDTFINYWNKQVRNNIIIQRDSDGAKFDEIPAIKFDEDEPVKLQADALVLLDIYYNDHMLKIEPAAVEKRVTGEYNGIPLLAYIDLIDANGIFYDHKLVWRSWKDGQADIDIQPTFYGLISGAKPIEFHFQFAKALKNPVIDDMVTKRTGSDYTRLGIDIINMWRQIQSGIFMRCGTGGWWCSDKYCGYWETCHSETNAEHYTDPHDGIIPDGI